MKAFLECVPCVLNQIIKILRKKVKNQKKREKILLDVLRCFSTIQLSSVTPPELTHEGHSILRKHLGNKDFYKEEKEESNKEALALVPKLEKTIRQSKNKLHDALLLAIAGNIIDYGPEHKFDINKTLRLVLKKKLSGKQFNLFRKKIKGSKRLLYICDNAGEIVFDRLLIEYLIENYDLEVTVAVKSKPVLNDALIEDARFIKLDKFVGVIESGSVTAGTSLDKVNKEFKDAYDKADIVIAKGQGNFETLPHDKKIFFLLMVKCAHLALATNLKYGEIVLWSKS
ncbi:MAG: DUF89 family protein [Candidatus Saganbacteria bacterium]|nr:DUF89 family protein [Candidatus Saganbacteria bacterium]